MSGPQPPSATNPTDVTLASYDDAAELYCAAAPETVDPVVAALLDAIARHVPGGRVLELGSGPGRDAAYLERLGLSVDRTDAVPAFVTRLRDGGYDARVLDVRTDDLGGPYDAVLAQAVFLHLTRADLEQALRACRSATRPGGVLALTLKEGDGEAWSDAKIGRPRWFVYWREQPLRDVLERAGWDVVHLEHVPGRTEPWLHVLGRH